MNERLARCRGLLQELRVDGVLVTDPVDVRYLSGFRGDDATLVIGADAALLCADSRFWEQVHEEVRAFELSKVTSVPLLAHSVAAAAEVLGPDAGLGYQAAQLSHASYRKLRRAHRGRLRDVRQSVTLLRALKDEDEIAAMRSAGAVTDEALAAVVARGLAGRSAARRARAGRGAGRRGAPLRHRAPRGVATRLGDRRRRRRARARQGRGRLRRGPRGAGRARRGRAGRMNERLDRCRAPAARRLRVDGVLVTDPVDVRYLSGFRGDDATLVVGARRGAALHRRALLGAGARGGARRSSSAR